MSSKVEPVPNEIVEQELVAPAQTALRHRLSAVAVFAATALLFLAACTSKNADALPGMNVDENLAIMDANAAENANLMTGNPSNSNAGSAVDLSNRPDRSSDERSTSVAPANPRGQDRLGEINGTETDGGRPSDNDGTGGNQVGNDDENPNDVQ